MKKVVTINGKEYSMKSSAYTQFKYKNDTGRNLLADIQNIADLAEKDNQMEAMEDMTLTLLKIAYTMIEEADSSQVTSYEDFLKSADGLFDDVTWVSEVVELAASPISRNLQNTKQEK